MSDTFNTLDGSKIHFESHMEQLKIEHILQRDRDVWTVIDKSPYLAINLPLLKSRMTNLQRFPVFSSGQLWQNFSQKDIGSRLIGMLVGGGVTAGFGANSGAFVSGKANTHAHTLVNWNPSLVVGSTPWCAEGTHLIYVDGDGGNLYQHQFGDLITTQGRSRTNSPHFDLTKLSDLRDCFAKDFLNIAPGAERDLTALSELLDKTFEQNSLSLAAAETLHVNVSVGMMSTDYEAPVLTKYDRPTHDATGQPKIEVVFGLLHYEKAIIEFNALKASNAFGNSDDAFAHGVYCMLAAAACIEAVANRLVYLQSSAHPTHNDRRTPLNKINDSATELALQAGVTYLPLVQGQTTYDTLDALRALRNDFMHAKELETDIDPQSLTSTLLTTVNESACRNCLAQLRNAVQHVFDQLPALPLPFAIKTNITWMGDLEVP